MHRKYYYIGPRKIAERSQNASGGALINSATDAFAWIKETKQELNGEGNVTATFVIDEDGLLRIADRRSEHVACAGGAPVLSAGELTFHVSRSSLTIAQVTNQSTGYCPEPESWPAVAAALEKTGLKAPPGFEPAFVFRRCEQCDSISIVKEGLFECAVCATALPEHWNFDTTSHAM